MAPCSRCAVAVAFVLAVHASVVVAERTVRPTAFNCNASIQGPPVVSSPDGSKLFVNNNGEAALDATTLQVDYSNANANIGFPFVVVSASTGWSVNSLGSIFNPTGQVLNKARSPAPSRSGSVQELGCSSIVLF